MADRPAPTRAVGTRDPETEHNPRVHSEYTTSRVPTAKRLDGLLLVDTVLSIDAVTSGRWPPLDLQSLHMRFVRELVLEGIERKGEARPPPQRANVDERARPAPGSSSRRRWD